MTEYPILQSERLLLRKIELRDIENLINYASSDKVSDNLFNYPNPYTEKDALARIAGINEGFKDKNRFAFVITIPPKDELIGEIGIRLETEHHKAEIGYWISEPYCNNGYATEAISAILRFGFVELGLNKIYATRFSSNFASGKVLEKNSMQQEGILRQEYYFKGQFRDSIRYSITKDQYGG